MDKLWAARPAAEDPAQIEVEIARLFAEMAQADERIKQQHDETDRLKRETRTMLDALKVK